MEAGGSIIEGLNDEQVYELFELWEKIPELEQGKLVALLLAKTRFWNEFAISDGYILGWLRAQFFNAGVDWPLDIR
jgi:hypothetical protein